MHLKKHKMVILVINNIFEEIKKEARCGLINLSDEDGPFPLRVSFNIVDDKIYEEIPNIYIKDKDKFNRIILEYVEKALKFYSLDPTEYNIKKVIAYSFSNITKEEMNCFENYLYKYIKFYDKKFNVSKGEKETSLGKIRYNIEKQSIMQETPYCFKSYFEKNNSKYALPRISFGINNDICEIYAIQNKDSKINTDQYYNTEVKNAFKTINRGISKYRNITPSFVIALTLFISFLRENNISKIKVVTPLPIRQANRKITSEYKIKIFTMKGDLSIDEVENVKKVIEESSIRDEYNSTKKFENCFNRLKLHFENLFYTNINNQMIINVLNLSTENELLKEIVKEKETDNYGKISKHSGS